MPTRRDRPLYLISVVAEMLGVHQQTLRTYEREGLIRPSRSDGNTRLYSQEDIERIELILRLTRELGVNLAGVEVILNMREHMESMQRQVLQMIEAMAKQMQVELQGGQGPIREGLVPVRRGGLARRGTGRG